MFIGQLELLAIFQHTLGNIYAGCLYKKIRNAVPNLDESLSQGMSVLQPGGLENIHIYGSLFEGKATVEKATGSDVSVKPFLTYIREKYTDIYRL